MLNVCIIFQHVQKGITQSSNFAPSNNICPQAEVLITVRCEGFAEGIVNLITITNFA
jgi:hypothetical protein